MTNYPQMGTFWATWPIFKNGSQLYL